MKKALLSEHSKSAERNVVVAILVGSFAPIHSGHLALCEAVMRLSDLGTQIVLAPNRDSHVLGKVGDALGSTWNIDTRLTHMTRLLEACNFPAMIDDMSCLDRTQRSITNVVIDTVARQLKVKNQQIIILCGSDQLGGMKHHINTNRCICVLRPGNLTPLVKQSRMKWYRKALKNGRLRIIERSLSHKEPSSSDIRAETLV